MDIIKKTFGREAAIDVSNEALAARSLPYFAAPLHDEVLGSWLARLRTLNGQGAWDWFVQQRDDTGGTPIRRGIFDIEFQSRSYCNLLAALGFSVEHGEASLTTNPFWQTFGGYRPNCRQNINTRSDQFKKNGVPASRSSGSAPIRFCPCCITVDHKAGACYWHRTHQVPAVLICPIHGVALRDSCLKCGTTVSVRDGGAIKVLPLSCASCGSSLETRLELQSSPLLDNYLRLARLAAAAISSERPPHGPDHVRTNFLFSFRKWARSTKRTYVDLFQNAYGVDHKSTNSLDGAAVARRLGLCQPLQLTVSPGRSGAVEIAAFFSAAEFDFDAVVKCLHSPTGPSSATKTTTVSIPKALTNESARSTYLEATRVFKTEAELRRWLKKQGSQVCHHLRLFDSVWFSERLQFKNDYPSVEQDRMKLAELATRHSDRTHVPFVARAGTAVRVKLRDRAWYDNFFQQISRHAFERRLLLTAHRDCGRANAISRVLWQINCDVTSRPKRILGIDLARRTGMSINAVRKMMVVHPGLRMEVADVNAGMLRRRLKWAIARMNGLNRPITVKTLVEFASVRLEPFASITAARIIADSR